MAEYYILPGATGGTGDSWASPWGSLPAALTRGDTYWLGNGSFGSYTFDDAGSTPIYIKKATVASHGKNDGWQDSYAAQAVFTSWYFTTGYYVIDGQTGGGPGNWRTGFGIKVAAAPSNQEKVITFSGSGVTNVTFKHIDVGFTGGTAGTSATGDAVYSYQSGNSQTWQYCWVHHAPRCLFYWQGISNVLVEYTCFEYCGRTTTDAHNELYVFKANIGQTISGLTVRYCYILDWRSTGGLMHGGSVAKHKVTGVPYPTKSQIAQNIHIYGNIFEGGTNRGASNNGVIGAWTHNAYLVRNAHVYNNTIVGITNTYPNAGDIFPMGNLDNITVRNNLWYDTPIPDIRASVQSNNQRYTSNPFANYVGKDYRLSAPTVNGYALASPYNYDMNEVLRGQALPGQQPIWDIGAFEYPQNSIVDDVKPIVTARSPVSGATGVPINSNITVTFSEAMDATTINSTNFTLANGGSVAGIVTYDANTYTATFNPNANLANSTLYTFTVGTGVKDVAQNAMAAQDQWTFTTASATDVTEPTLNGTKVPSSGATSVSVNTTVSAVFSEALDPTTVNSTTCKLMQGSTQVEAAVTYDNTTFKVMLTPVMALAYNTTYTPTFTTDIKDVAGNALAAQQTWNFTTLQGVLDNNRYRVGFPNNPSGAWGWDDSASLLIGWGQLYIGPEETPTPTETYATLIGQDGSIYRIKQLKTGLWITVI